MKPKISFILFALGLFAWNSCNYSGDPLSDEQRERYMSLGQSTVQNAGANLMSNLVSALEDGGVEAAVPFCKLNADSILNAAAEADGILSIRRTTTKYRNKANKAKERDKNIFKVYAYALKRGDSLKPILQLDPENHEVLYYAPILVQPTCMKCHGNKDEGYTAENFKIINEHYPKDKAFNYSVGDVRGMWVVTMKDVHSTSE